MKNFIGIVFVYVLLFSSCDTDLSTQLDQSTDDITIVEVITSSETYKLQYHERLDSFLFNQDLEMARQIMEDDGLVIYEIVDNPNTQYLFPNDVEFYKYYMSIDKEYSSMMLFSTYMCDLSADPRSQNREFLISELSKIKRELAITSSVEELLALLPDRDDNPSNESITPRWDKVRLYEHKNFGGQALQISEYTANTYGEYFEIDDCAEFYYYPNLLNFPKYGEESWNDEISSLRVNGETGYKSWALRLFRDINWSNGHRSCYEYMIVSPNGLIYSMSDMKKRRWCWFGRRLNDSISGIRYQQNERFCNVGFRI